MPERHYGPDDELADAHSLVVCRSHLAHCVEDIESRWKPAANRLDCHGLLVAFDAFREAAGVLRKVLTECG